MKVEDSKQREGIIPLRNVWKLWKLSAAGCCE